MKVNAVTVPGVMAGNAWQMDTRNSNTGQNKSGWLVGHSDAVEYAPLFLMKPDASATNIGIKWFKHHPGETSGGKPVSVGRSISILTNEGGRVRIRFWTVANPHEKMEVTLTEPGDFALWGAGICHEWEIENDSTVITVRWVPEAV